MKFYIKMKYKDILVIEPRKNVRDLVSFNFQDLGKDVKEIYFVNDYYESKKILKDWNSSGKEYFVLADSKIWKGYEHVCTSRLFRRIIDSGNKVILYSSEELEGLNKSLRELIDRENLHYVVKSSSYGNAEEFFSNVLEPAGLEKLNN